jgi:hypothetical protein
MLKAFLPNTQTFYSGGYKNETQIHSWYLAKFIAYM